MILRVEGGHFGGRRFLAHVDPCAFCGCSVVYLREAESSEHAFMFETEATLSMVNLDGGEVLIEPVHSHHMCPGLLKHIEKTREPSSDYKRRAMRWPTRN